MRKKRLFCVFSEKGVFCAGMIDRLLRGFVLLCILEKRNEKQLQLELHGMRGKI